MQTAKYQLVFQISTTRQPTILQGANGRKLRAVESKVITVSRFIAIVGNDFRILPFRQGWVAQLKA